MALKLFYITNDPNVALIAEKHGVDRIWVDLETLGKTERQPGNSVKSNHRNVIITPHNSFVSEKINFA